MTEVKTGLGHQLMAERRAVEACKTDLEIAYASINKSKDPAVQELAIKLACIIGDALMLSYRMAEAYHQND